MNLMFMSFVHISFGVMIFFIYKHSLNVKEIPLAYVIFFSSLMIVF